jgi:hypothetical protein
LLYLVATGKPTPTASCAATCRTSRLRRVATRTSATA